MPPSESAEKAGFGQLGLGRVGRKTRIVRVRREIEGREKKVVSGKNEMETLTFSYLT